MPDQQTLAYEARYSHEREAKDKLKASLSVGPERGLLDRSIAQDSLDFGEYAGECKIGLDGLQRISQRSTLGVPIPQYICPPEYGNYGEPDEIEDTACKRVREARSKKGKSMRRR